MKRNMDIHTHIDIFGKTAMGSNTSAVEVFAEQKLAPPAIKTFVALITLSIRVCIENHDSSQ
jgi:hypothetical protein